jgi:hypothetical protein
MPIPHTMTAEVSEDAQRPEILSVAKPNDRLSSVRRLITVSSAG